MLHRFVLHNQEIREASDTVLSPGQVGLLAGWGVFSTIRVVDGVLFAYERHWARMARDARLLRVPLPPDSEDVRRRLLSLVVANQALNAAMRVAVVRNKGGLWEGPQTGGESDLLALTADLKSWGSGVRLCYTPQARHAASPFAGAKILSWAGNLAFLEEAQCKGFDETILLNEHGEVAECTSANIFVVRRHEVWTPPLSSGCLPGITREVLLRETHVPGYSIAEKSISPAELEHADEVFITSTTRELLPVIQIEDREIAHPGIARKALQTAFSHYVDEYVSQHRVTTAARD